VSRETEVEAIRQRYARRNTKDDTARMDPLNPANFLYRQEKERAFIRWLRASGLDPAVARVLEVGCGGGANLHQLLTLGFKPENLVGNDLLDAHAAIARASLPAAVQVHAGDASVLGVDGAFDVVMASTVFSSILDDGFQAALAAKMWAWVKPRGGVLWYDFTYDNPQNPDVRGVPLARVRDLFPQGQVTSWRVGLAPPVRRLVTRVHPQLYTLFNLTPALRTHVLCWITRR
jgi:SAM-dependent methyltransferase